MSIDQQEDLSILFAGEAGQGLQTLEKLMLTVFKRSGFHVFSFSEVMSRIRGGSNSTEIRISTFPVHSLRERVDLFVPFTRSSLKRYTKRLTPRTIILGDAELIPTQQDCSVVEVPFTKMAKDAGSARSLNMIAFGFLCGIFGVELELITTSLGLFLSGKDAERVSESIRAASKGYDGGVRSRRLIPRALPVFENSPALSNAQIMNGTEAIGMGGLAGGCTFVASYPMSPSTDLLVFFARHAHNFGVVVEQAEDEISAVNMALGSWYAGGKALVTTSGGGFALMIEGLSLAGAIESPLVIHVGQRPGPATGLPTRTEQADLEHVLYSGHGEFPRAILAPGTIQEGFSLTRHAFDLADRYQVPVIILTDQNYLESSHLISGLDMNAITGENHIIETDAGYRRYSITDDGVSPRGIPGYGAGIVCVDSDEHDDGGYITEDMAVRTAMVEKRLRKLRGLETAVVPPTLVGKMPCKYLIVGWGSTFHVVDEALKAWKNSDIAFLHYSQVYPLYAETADLLLQADKRIIIENNATSQFGRLIKLHTGIDFHEHMLKFDGMPFMLEQVIERLKTFVEGPSDAF